MGRGFKRFGNCDILVWPVYCNYTKEEWDRGTLEEYVEQASAVTSNVLFINSHSKEPLSLGGAYYFCDGKIQAQLDMGVLGVLYLEI